ncbi:Fructose-1, 6-bisphosphatase/inositol-1-monophosphatase [archaeon HR05]|nr:Fructose-1, 6-bisphosphatase/inositol-1-monophosphatase [archaeon HR05]
MDSIMSMLHDICMNVRSKVSKMSREEAGISLARGAGGDITKKIDKVGEDAALEVVREYDVSCRVLSEEAGLVDSGRKGRGGADANASNDDGSCIIVLDAIDGTTNAVRGIPFYSCSVAYATSDRLSSVTHAAVMDLTSGDIYYAVRGNGAYMNGSRIKTANVSSDRAGYVIGINLSGISIDKLKRMSSILAMTNHIRQFGSNALEMCLLARGLLDAYIDVRGKIRVTDIAAACLIIVEAGGIVVDEHLNILDAPLSLDARLSFIASADKSMLNYIFSSIASS